MSDPRPRPPGPPLEAVRRVVARALEEDLGPLGDLTAALIPAGARARGALVARAPGVLAGRACAEEAFAAVDGAISSRWRLEDGDAVGPGTVLADVEGPLPSVLTAERTALNLLCHLSGVASLTRAFVEAAGAAHPGTRILDTRKTTPGLRALEKAAVRAGGGANHRASLSEAVLVKDNHLTGMSITDAVGRARALWPGRTVEVECDRLEQVREALSAGASMVLLDNMGPEEVAGCVAEVRAFEAGGRPVLVEVSGGVTLGNVAAYAAAGADVISVGSLTHSAPALDIGLDLEEG